MTKLVDVVLGAHGGTSGDLIVTLDQLLIGDVVYAGLLYGVQPYLVKPWAKGVGGTALYDFSWTSARMLQH